LPAYQDSIRKGRRSDALQALAAVQLAQERWRSNNAEYTQTLGNLSVSSATAGGHYTLSLAAASAATDAWRTGYRVVATAVGGQAGDTNCRQLGVEVNGGIVRNGAGDTAIDWSLAEPDPNRCWAR
jgi:type IV pilus assembly protein PilE